jgi:nucleoside-diphosphate-sugar epimerase
MRSILFTVNPRILQVKLALTRLQNHSTVHSGCPLPPSARSIPSDLVSQRERLSLRSLRRRLLQIPLNSGHTRDLTYVADTVEGFIKFAESKKTIGKTVNTGSGRGVAIGELANLIIKHVNPKAIIISDKKRVRPEKSEVMQLLCDNRCAKDLAGWEPKYTLEEGLSLTIDWMKENIMSYKTGLYTV